jgi:hypothetical protein
MLRGEIRVAELLIEVSGRLAFNPKGTAEPPHPVDPPLPDRGPGTAS